MASHRVGHPEEDAPVAVRLDVLPDRGPQAFGVLLRQLGSRFPLRGGVPVGDGHEDDLARHDLAGGLRLHHRDRLRPGEGILQQHPQLPPDRTRPILRRERHHALPDEEEGLAVQPNGSRGRLRRFHRRDRFGFVPRLRGPGPGRRQRQREDHREYLPPRFADHRSSNSVRIVRIRSGWTRRVGTRGPVRTSRTPAGSGRSTCRPLPESW